MSHVYSVTPKGSEKRVLVMAAGKAEAERFVHRDTNTERLTSQDVVAAMRAGEEILSAAPPSVDPAQTEFSGLNVTP